MPEPIDSLSRFTPDATGLDRDALLFAAGRASARPNRYWALLAGTLAVSQLLTLVVLWPMATGPDQGHAVSGAMGVLAAPSGTLVPSPSPQPAATMDVPALALGADGKSGERADPGEARSLLRQLLDSKDGDLPPTVAAGTMVPGDPPLRVFANPANVGLE